MLRLFSHLEAALVGIEACHTAHRWAHEIAALGTKSASCHRISDTASGRAAAGRGATASARRRRR